MDANAKLKQKRKKLNFIVSLWNKTRAVNSGYCFTPYQRLRLYNGAPFSRLLRHAGDTEDIFSA